MKKITVILAALAAAFAVSCTKEAPEAQLPQDQNAPAGMKMVTITASIEGADTKTSYTNNGDGTASFSWTKGDQISVRCIDKSSNRKYFTFTANETGPSVIFSGSIPDDYTLETEAFFPASEDHDWVSWQPYYNIPMYRPMYIGDDSKGRLSADIPMFAKATDGVYNFTHMCGAALLTFTNFPDFITKAKVSIVNSALKISGTFKVSYSGANSEYMTWNSASAANDSEKTYIREVPVENNQTQLYLPYHGELWGTSTISIIGYDVAGVEYTLLNGKSMKGNSTRFERGVVQPYAPLVLPDYVPEADLSKIDWNAENVATVTNSSTSDDSVLEELKVVADNYHMYVRIKSALQTPYGADFIDILLSDGDADAEGAAVAWDQWPGTLGIDLYKKEHKGTIDAEGNITSMTFNHNGTYENIEFKNEIVDGKITWYMIFPVDYMEKYKSPTGTVHVGFRLWTDWANFAAIPARGWGQSMLEVTLP